MLLAEMEIKIELGMGTGIGMGMRQLVAQVLDPFKQLEVKRRINRVMIQEDVVAVYHDANLLQCSRQSTGDR